MPNSTGHAITAGGRERIQSFVDDYHIVDEDRALTMAERRLITEALIDYLFAEERLMRPAKLRADAALRAVDTLHQHLSPMALPTLKLIKQCIVDLAGRLEHREDANLIMREDCVMLSETIRQLRSTGAN